MFAVSHGVGFDDFWQSEAWVKGPIEMEEEGNEPKTYEACWSMISSSFDESGGKNNLL